MAAPRRSWLVFGFSAEEAAGEPSPGPGPRRLEPGPEGIEGIRRVWPAWSYAVLDTGAGLEVLGAGLRRRLPAGCAEALPSETHVLLLRGGPGAAVEAWPRAAALRGELRGAPAWRRALPPGPRRPPLPLLPGGFAVPRPPFFCELPPAPPLRALALGHEHVLALGANGEVYGWGGGRHGQLGHGGLESEQQPRLVEALAGVPMRAVAAGGWHSASISEGGDLYMWGWNESGQLALPSKAVAEEQEEDEDAGTGEDAAGCSKAVPSPWDGAARAERRCSQGLRSRRPPGSSRAPPSFQSRHSRPCWTCPRTWRLMLSAAGPGTRPQSHETASSTPGAGGMKSLLWAPSHSCYVCR
ncbi:RCC1 domain-containing protein 1 isoform X4 [Anas platyrhynchos]|uniref:RCC1 domain-containing protein 1 isoform X4 n=1 Tax=Anas platyrhynchos TaxID=8839 RepID=UPI003AF2186D